MIYINTFTGIQRKYINNVGFVSNDGGITWSENKTPEGLIKSLPYYKVSA